jgi:hypothetical protein
VKIFEHTNAVELSAVPHAGVLRSSTTRIFAFALLPGNCILRVLTNTPHLTAHLHEDFRIGRDDASIYKALAYRKLNIPALLDSTVQQLIIARKRQIKAENQKNVLKAAQPTVELESDDE